MSEPSGTAAAQPASVEGVVELQVPAASAFVAVLRSVTAALAARCDLTLDEIEDLRIAVDEACALLMPVAAIGAALRSVFTLGPGELDITVQVAVRSGAEMRRDGFGWTVLEALVDKAVVNETTTDDVGATMTITLTKRRESAAK